MSSRDAAKKRAGSTTDETTEGRSGRRNRRFRPCWPRPAAGAAPARGEDPDAGDGHVAVIEVSGLLDEVLVDFVETQITDAEEDGALALVLQLNSSGAVVDDDRFDELLERIETAEVPVDVWVGPSGSRATGEAADLLAAARVVGVSGRQPGGDHAGAARRRDARRRGRGRRQGERRRGRRPGPGRQRRAHHRRVRLRRSRRTPTASPGSRHRGRRRASANPSPRRSSASSPSTASSCTPWPAHRWPTCCS